MIPINFHEAMLIVEIPFARRFYSLDWLDFAAIGQSAYSLKLLTPRKNLRARSAYLAHNWNGPRFGGGPELVGVLELVGCARIGGSHNQ